MSENGEIYTAGKNFTLPPAVTAWTNSTSEVAIRKIFGFLRLWGSPHPTCQRVNHVMSVRHANSVISVNNVKYVNRVNSGNSVNSVSSRGGIWLQSQRPSTRVYGDYSLIIAKNRNFGPKKRGPLLYPNHGHDRKKLFKEKSAFAQIIKGGNVIFKEGGGGWRGGH